MQTSRKTVFCQKNETSTGLKITFVDMTYPGERPELPSLSHHFLLILSYISDGLTAWVLASKSYLTKILVLQKRALRFIIFRREM